MTKRRTIMRDQRAPIAPTSLTASCTRCAFENVSPDGRLPESWKPIEGGVHCPDCAAHDEGQANG